MFMGGWSGSERSSSRRQPTCRRTLIVISALVAATLHLAPSQLETRPEVLSVAPGVDVLREMGGSRLEGRIGLITNHTGRAADGVSTLSVLRDELGKDVRALFSPEHGYRGDVAAGDHVGSDTRASIPIHSLYGDTRRPTTAMLEQIDTLVFDIQDIGVRFYTYVSTMKLAMEEAAASGVAFVVLDRPNPLGGLRVEGPVLELEFESFVGAAPIPLVHGMTAGELARLFAATIPKLELDVVSVRGLRRDMRWHDTGLSWIAPSPNIRAPRVALAYPALGLIESINVNEGRGVDETFERIGAPWLDGDALLAELSSAGLPGVRFRSTSFTPRATAAAPRPKYRDEMCRGIAMTITDPVRFEAVRTGLTTIAAIRALHPDAFEWVRRDERYWIDSLLGTDRPRLALEDGITVDAILEREERARVHFMARRRAHLLY